MAAAPARKACQDEKRWPETTNTNRMNKRAELKRKAEEGDEEALLNEKHGIQYRSRVRKLLILQATKKLQELRDADEERQSNGFGFRVYSLNLRL